jgi:Na+/proline symporter
MPPGAFLLAQAGQLPLDWLDITVLVVTLLGVAAFGMYMGRREEGASDYFLAGRSVA